MTRQFAASLALVATILSASGCSFKMRQQAVNETPRNLYRIEIPAPAESTAPASLTPVLLVRPVEVAAAFGSGGFIRRDAKGVYTEDPYNRFFIPPTDEIQSAIIAHLRASNRFEAVISDYSTLRPTYVLESSVSELYGAESSSGSTAVTAIRFVLIERRSPTETRVIHDRTYRRETTIPSLKSDDLKQGWESGITGILTEFGGSLPVMAGPQQPDPAK